MNRQKVLGVIFSVIVLGVGILAPVPMGLSLAGKNTIGLLIAALILWVTEALPLGVTALALILFMPILGIMDVNSAFKEFISPVFFFVIATYGISVAIMNSPMADRMAEFFLKWAGNSSNKIVLGFMVGAAILSAIVSNVPVTALFMGLALGILEPLGAKPGSSQLGKALMIGIPFGAMIGGIATPAGSSINILALYLLEKYAHVTVSFLDWMIFGIPICILLLPISWVVLVKVFKIENVDEQTITPLINNLNIPEKITKKEWKIIAVVGAMIILWVLSTWIKSLNITLVAIAGLIIFFLPGMDVFTWEEFNQEVSWDAVLMIGGVTSLGAAVFQSGLGEWIVNQSLQGVSGLGVVPLTLAVGTLVNLLHIPLPVSPAIVAVTVQPISNLALINHINPAIFGITIAFLAGCSLLLPLDAVPLITYTKKYYTIWDMFKVGFIISFIWILLTALWVPFAAQLLHY